MGRRRRSTGAGIPEGLKKEVYDGIGARSCAESERISEGCDRGQGDISCHPPNGKCKRGYPNDCSPEASSQTSQKCTFSFRPTSSSHGRQLFASSSPTSFCTRKSLSDPGLSSLEQLRQILQERKTKNEHCVEKVHFPEPAAYSPDRVQKSTPEVHSPSASPPCSGPDPSCARNASLGSSSDGSAFSSCSRTIGAAAQSAAGCPASAVSKEAWGSADSRKLRSMAPDLTEEEEGEGNAGTAVLAGSWQSTATTTGKTVSFPRSPVRQSLAPNPSHSGKDDINDPFVHARGASQESCSHVNFPLKLKHGRRAPARVVRLKITSLGDAETGKSCLMKRFSENRFFPKYIPTIGIDYGVKDVRLDSISGVTIKANLFDTSGLSDYAEAWRPFLVGTQGLILVFDVTRRETFFGLSEWLGKAEAHGLPVHKAAEGGEQGEKTPQAKLSFFQQAVGWPPAPPKRESRFSQRQAPSRINAVTLPSYTPADRSNGFCHLEGRAATSQNESSTVRNATVPLFFPPSRLMSQLP